MTLRPLLLCMLVLLTSLPALAQDAGGSNAEAVSGAEEVVVTKEQIALSEQMHDIWPIRTRIEDALDSVAEQFPEPRRAEIKATMRKSIRYDELEEESIKAMARIFTEDELKAMVDFYSSEAGRSVSAKTGLYEQAITPVLTRMLDKAVLDLRTGSTTR